MPKLPPRDTTRREADVSADVRSYLASEGVTNWRNTVGRGTAQSGHYITYGLCEGSADLIACVPTRLACPTCGAQLPPVGRFVGIETKHPRGGRKEDDQKAWHRVVAASFGVVGFARDVEQARAIIDRARFTW